MTMREYRVRDQGIGGGEATERCDTAYQSGRMTV